MKKALFLVVALVFALSAGALANELYNGSWQSGNDEGWFRSGGNVVDTTSYFGNPGPAPGETDIYGYAIASSWGTGDGNIAQDIYVDSGLYNVTLGGWMRAMDGWGIPSTINLQLLIDDVLVNEQQVSASGGDTGWIFKQIDWTGNIVGKTTVKLVTHVDGQEAGPGDWPWGIAYADGISLEQTLVPEPASMLALAAGLVGMVIRRKK